MESILEVNSEMLKRVEENIHLVRGDFPPYAVIFLPVLCHTVNWHSLSLDES